MKEIESYIEILIMVHAGLGTIALITGALAIFSKKGSLFHKRSGKLFYFAMLTSVTLSLFIAIMPGHESSFLFAIGIFSSYFILIGRRALFYRDSDINITWDKCLMITIIFTGILMITYPILLHNNLNIILTIFGSTGILLAIMDWRIITDATLRKKNWLLIHATRIIGGYIAAITAFFVVNGALPGIWGWILPGILGGFYIAYWANKLKSN